MSGQLFDAPRIHGFYLDCDIPVIIGDDTTDGPDHCLYDLSERNRVGDPIFAAEIVADGGIHTPIKCRQNGVIKAGGCIEVGIGRRRVKAARLIKHQPGLVRSVLDQLGLSIAIEHVPVPVIVEKHTDEEWARLVASENAQRKDLSVKLVAEQAVRLLARVKDKRRVAVTYGVSVQTVSEWEMIRDCDEYVVARIGNGPGLIALTAAAKLSKLPREQQVERMKQVEAEGGRMTVARSRAAVKGGDATEKLKDRQIRKIAECEDCDPIVRNCMLMVLGEFPITKIKGVSKALARPVKA